MSDTSPKRKSEPAKPTEPKAEVIARLRSPNYPAISLGDAVKKVRTLYAGKIKRHAVGTDVVAKEWGNSPKSSDFRLALAAMRSFGLLADEDNGGSGKLVKLTHLALDIVADYAEGAPEQREAIKRAAMNPKLHDELWKRWGASLPPDEEIRRYLVRERGFNDNTVALFITEYKATLSFAKLGEGDKIEEEDQGKDGAPAPPDVKVGDGIQWTSMGMDMFDKHMPVLAFSEDRKYLFVPPLKEGGTDSGIPVDEVTVVERAVQEPVKKIPPPPNPFAGSGVATPKAAFEPPPPAGLREDVYDLTGGRAVLRYPATLDAGSVEELEEWLELIVRKMRRMNSLPAKTDPNKPKGSQG